MAKAQWQPDYQQTAAMMTDARNKGWSNSKIKSRFGSMGMDLQQMAGYRKSIPIPSHEELMKGRSKLKALDSYNKSGQSIPDKQLKSSLNFNTDPMAGVHYNAPSYGPGNEPDPGGTSWWDKVGSMLGSDGALGGIKGWLDLGVKGLNAWSGYKQVGLAEEQNQLGREAFGFQKAAWNKDYNARKIAYNTNARDVNAWKAAQTPGGYTMSELVV